MKPLKINVILHPLLLLLISGLLCCVPSLVSAKIVFCVDGDIFVSNDDGSRRRRLTHSTQATHRYPSWSPDGTKIAFTRYMDSTQRQTTGELFIMNADGTDPQRLTHNNFTDSDPCWSPDGRQIAFSSTRSEDWEVFIIDLATLAVRQLTDAPSASPDWSPDGSQIAFERFIDIANGITPKTIYVMDADGRHQRRVTPDPPLDGPLTYRFFPRFSSDGERILFYESQWFREGDVVRFIVQRIGGRTQKITDINDRLDENLLIAGASWMQNDTAFVFSAKRLKDPTRTYDLYRYTFDTRRLRRLTRDASDEKWPDWTEGALSVSPHRKMTTLWAEIKTDRTDSPPH
jgi:Tol biopolymer transport system component